MSRRLIISLLVLLIVGVVGGTIALVISRLNADNPNPTTTAPNGSLGLAQNGGQNVVDPTGDDNGDGLSNSDESLWGTDRKNPDTDGDGFLDGEEVANNHNPTIPAPNDILPLGFKPGQDLQPIAVSSSEPVAVGQFFADNVDLSLGSKNYTEEYRSQYSEADQTKDTLKEYVVTQQVATQLPTPIESTFNILPADSALNLDEYIKVASKSLPLFSNQSLFSEALSELITNNDASYIRGVSLQFQIYQEKLLKTPVPPSAVTLQKVLVGYTQLLIATFDQIAVYPTDNVRAIVAIKQWQEADAIYIPIIQAEIARLLVLQSSL